MTGSLQPSAGWQTATDEVDDLPALEEITVTVMRTRTSAVEVVDVQAHSNYGTDQVVVSYLEVTSDVGSTLLHMDPHHVVSAALDPDTDVARYLPR